MPLYKYFNLINFFIFYLSSLSITLFYHPLLIYISDPYSLLFSITTMIIIIIIAFMSILIHYPIKYIIYCF